MLSLAASRSRSARAPALGPRHGGHQLDQLRQGRQHGHAQQHQRRQPVGRPGADHGELRRAPARQDVDAASVSAGDPIGYTLTISNTGAGTATGVNLTDSLPGGNAATPVHWVIDPATGDPASFGLSGADGSQVLSLAGQPITLGPGASLSVHVTAATSSTSCATYDNSASVTSTNDGNPTAGPVTITVNCGDLAITKVADAASVSAGTPIGYTLTISNTGAGTVAGVSLTDSLPGGNAATAVHWVIDPATGDPASFGLSGADGSQVLSLAGQPITLGPAPASRSTSRRPASSTSCGRLRQHGHGLSSTNDGNPSVGPVPITVNCAALQLAKTFDAASVSAGDPIGYTLTISNTGAGTATGVNLTDSLPGGNAATPVHWVIDPATGDPASFGLSGADGSQVLSLAGQPITLGPGASLSVHVTAATSSTSCAALRQLRQRHQHQRRQPHRGPGDDHRQLR